MRPVIKNLFAASVLLLLWNVAFAAQESGDAQHVPDLRWLNGAGEEQRLYDIKDKPKLLHFWAAWCIPCREEMPELVEWRNQNPEIEVLPLSLDQRIAQTKHFLKKYKIDLPAMLLNEEDGNALGVPLVPYTLFVSADNRLLDSYPGIAPWLDAEFTASVRELMLK